MGWESQPRGRDGKWVKGGAGVTVAAAAVGLAVVGGAGGAATGAAVPAANAAARAEAAAKPNRGARKTKADDGWRKLRLRNVREATENALDCAINSYGQVRDFFLRNPCADLDRTLFTLADPAGNTFVVSVAWVRMRSAKDVRPLKALIDTDGTGSVKSLGFDLLKQQGVRFTGTPFRSRPSRDVLVVAEGAAVSGKPDPTIFRQAVDLAAELPR
ncbi:hypothetical protein JOD54_000373 [Actinokineospora baliensis]|uniref:hypothetical protein n=1 Tax=Actinokineospora baliensis TaxID=547056 RepID=UPI0019570333|nr:hypothetical protein [Actinokineospora baliensis]MBM7770169.1 hypothetical protein [Actinokineospora baliensis]